MNQAELENWKKKPMRKVQAPTARSQKNGAAMRWQTQKVTLQNQPVPVQPVVPQAAYWRAQANHNGLTPATLSALQRTVGNRQVQRIVAREEKRGDIWTKPQPFTLIPYLQRAEMPEEDEGPIQRKGGDRQFVQAQMDPTPISLPVKHAERIAQIEALKLDIQSRRKQRDKLKADFDRLPKVSTEDEEILKDQKILKDEIVAAENYLIEGLAGEVAAIDQALEKIYQILPGQSGVGVPEVSPEVWAEITRLETEKKAAAQERLALQRGHVRDEIQAIEEKLQKLPVVSTEWEKLEKRKKELGDFLSSTAESRTPQGTVGKDYVVYQNEVKVGGALPWLNNNPGNVTKASSAEGVIGFNPAGIGFVIFKDWESGVKASGKWWDARRAKSPGDTIGNAILIYSQGLDRSPKALADAEEYTAQVESWTGLKRTQTLGSLSGEELAKLKVAILRKEGGLSERNIGKTYTCASTSTPPEYRRLLGCDK